VIAAHRLAVGQAPHLLVLTGGTHRMFRTVEQPSDATIRTLGYVPENDLRALMTGAAAFVYPSRYEGFGLPPLEAMACGTPPIVTDLPVLRESTHGRATYVAAGDVDAWSRAIMDAVEGRIPAPGTVAWSWADSVEQLRAALTVLKVL
jgi:glycosyltransferase involved in cell wall biosynthesis